MSKARIATYSLILLMFLTIVIAGCASYLDRMTEEELWEKQWREQVDRENWELCQLAYHRAGVTMHFDHAHSDDEKPLLIRFDLSRHNCQSILREYWIDY
jgi:hypothetical protein